MPLDDADKKTIAEIVGAALAKHGEESDKKYVTAEAAGKMVEQGVKGGIDSLKLPDLIGEAVKKAIPTTGADKSKEGGADPGKGKETDKGNGGASPEVLRLQEQLEKLENKNREADQRAQAAEAASRKQKLDGELRTALQAAGISPGLMDAAMALLPSRQLADGKPVLLQEADGTVKYRVQRKGYVDTVTVSDGLKDWLTTDEGKNYLPPTGKQGDGSSAGGTGGSQTSSNVPKKADGSIDFGALARNLSSNALTTR